MSRYLVLSDVHSNLEALDAVLTAASKQKCDAVIVLGDLVGYGADPNAVVTRIKALKPMAVVRGNHDKVAAGLETSEGFNPMAQAAVAWTQRALTPGTLEYLRAMPAGPLLVGDEFEICHGSPLDEDLYVVADLDAIRSIEKARRSLCLFGHTHVAIAYRRLPDRLEMPAGPGDTDQVRLPLDGDARYLVNVGSVGQPRDGDPRAAAGIVDTAAGMIELYRVRYAVEEAQRKIRMAGLPEVLARRLALGR